MTVRRPLVLMLIVSLLTVPGLWPVAPPPPAGAQGTEVWIKATGSGARKLTIAIPEFTVTTVSPGADAGTAGKLLASVAGADLTFSGRFSVVAATGAIPVNNPDALRQSWAEFAAAGAHARVPGLVALRGDPPEGEVAAYGPTGPPHRLVASKKVQRPAA